MKSIYFIRVLGLVFPSIDNFGIFGSIAHYALILAFVSSAFLVFLYLWSKGCLDMDEDPKIQMMQDQEMEDSHGPRAGI